MITLAQQLSPMPGDIASVRIESLFKAYGADYSFLTFWVQQNAGQITACLCRFYGHFTLWANKAADFTELQEFLQIMAGGEIFCAKEAAEKLNFSLQSECIALKCGQNFALPQDTPEISLQRVYDLLLSGRDGPIALPDFADWYPDISHRLRHGCARVAATAHSVALAGYEAQNAAIITGVATEPTVRGQGYGRQAVADLCAALQQQNKQIFVYTTQQVALFYTKMGFVSAGVYCILNSK